MRHTSELRVILKRQLQWDKRKLDVLIHTIIAVIHFRSVNLTQLTKGLNKTAAQASRYRRLQRLISQWPEKTDWISIWLLGWFFDANEKISLTMDRTNWQWGKAHINFLFIGVVYRRMAIPLIWILLLKKGNSNTDERIALLKRLFRYLPKARICNLLCDREFVGKRWFLWLKNQKIPYKIRLKHNYLTLTSGGKETRVDALFYGLNPGEKRIIRTSRAILGSRVYLTGSRLKSGELMIVASSELTETAIEQYCERWEIETLFQNLKSRGFDFESTHITDPDRLSALMNIVILSACWCYRTGEWRIEEKDEFIQLKKHGRPSVSLFRHGLDLLQDCFSGSIVWKTVKPLVAMWAELPPLSPVATL